MSTRFGLIVFPTFRSLQNTFHSSARPIEAARRNIRFSGPLLLALLTLSFAPRPVAAHAVLLESTPAPKSISSGPGIAIRLRFNVRIDAERSTIALIRADGSSEKLQPSRQPAANILTATATGLPAGDYRIRWQVLAPDGHITSGEIPFHVGGSQP